jgi:hypothetical protein
MKDKEGRDYLELTRCVFWPGSDQDAGLFVFANTCEALRLTSEDMKRVVKFVAAHGIGGKKSNSPQRKPLTDDEIGKIAVNSQDGISPHDDTLRFARAIERAHGIGSEE